MPPLRIAIDAMGGDYGPRATVTGTALALAERPNASATLYGRHHLIDDELSRLPATLAHVRERIDFVEAGDCLPVDMTPSRILRDVPSGSLHASLVALRDGEAKACVSGEHTGAIMALARRHVGMLSAVSRPAISAAIPTVSHRPCYMLDLGANVDARAEHLVDFAFMGAAMVRLVDNVSLPRVGLLNVGTESSKGERRVREADAMLRASGSSHIEYVGYVEGDGLFIGNTDVAVCDGMVGNVALKGSEGLARMLGERLQAEFQTGWYARVVGRLAAPVLRRFLQELNPVRYNGASFLGLRATVVKSHGSARAEGFAYAVRRAVDEAAMNLPDRLMS
ncbi:phosphate acyltransferase PlsX [Kushneria indalinina]|uniref:Phosphate acyltransferase n=1 Tax=Kushneria indalinina DSM 14324 TaxID=1122140 RepID=A0A3D9DZ49_9GAMM|nr:phosphate acyltransferase PlsX [Kushneria indalinina]REC96076.1 phosphate:acyl-[acyl carrier protein] acyltransferase [Kushneria indalinina DSM 14324]